MIEAKAIMDFESDRASRLEVTITSVAGERLKFSCTMRSRAKRLAVSTMIVRTPLPSIRLSMAAKPGLVSMGSAPLTAASDRLRQALCHLNTARSIPGGPKPWVRARRASLALLPQRPRHNERRTGADVHCTRARPRPWRADAQYEGRWDSSFAERKLWNSGRLPVTAAVSWPRGSLYPISPFHRR
jgi:hypothetical protein